MNVTGIIVDDFLDKPDLVRSAALQLEFTGTGQFPGLRSDRADEDYERYIKTKFEKILNLKIKEFVQDSFRFQLCTGEAETWIHSDETDWAAVLYLTPNPPVEAGTGLYRKTGEEWELVSAFGNLYNRLVLYPGRLYHKSIMPGFGNTRETGRLTQVFFFNLENE